MNDDAHSQCNRSRDCPTRRLFLLFASAAAIGLGSAAARAGDAEPHPLLSILESEMKLSMDGLVGPDESKPYFIEYSVTDGKGVNISATLGALTGDDEMHRRVLDVSVRCGDYACDNTRQIRGGSYFGGGDMEYGWGDIGTLELHATNCPFGIFRIRKGTTAHSHTFETNYFASTSLEAATFINCKRSNDDHKPC